jgi:hypothetical protein
MSAQHADPMQLVEATFARARAHATAVEGTLTSDKMKRAEHSDVEELLGEQGREWARLMFDEYLKLRAAAEKRVEVIGSDGVERTSARDSERQLESLLGRLPIGRLAYQARGAEDLHPLDASLNLPREMFSHGIRRMVAKEAANVSFDDVVEMVHDYTGSTIAKRQVEELTIRAAQDFDAFYEQRKLEKAKADEVAEAERDKTNDLLVISGDGKGIVMRHEDLREATRRAAEKKVKKLETRLAPGEKSDRKRMAQVATVYSIERWQRSSADVLHTLKGKDAEKKRPKPYDKRVWASVEKQSRRVIREAFAEALRRDPEKRRQWVVLVDGDRKQLRAVKTEAKRAGVTVTLVLDIVHVLEYVWKAARALFGESNADAEKWVGDRLLALLTGRTGGEVAATIRWWAARKKPKKSELAQLETACKYLANRSLTRLMRYADALRDGLPIATGVIEGACRYLVKDRMDKTGARWSLTGAEAVLRLRAIRASGDFDAYWKFHLARDKERNHASRYAEGEIPDPLPAPKPRLRRVK